MFGFAGVVKSKISPTKFSCVVHHEHAVYASTFGRPPKVCVYKYESEWSLVRSCDVALSPAITMCAWQGGVRCCSSVRNEYFCDCDSFGNALMADCNNSQLEVITELCDFRQVQLKPEVIQPRSAVLFEGRLYVISTEDNAVLLYA